jgi:hypothetical protein
MLVLLLQDAGLAVNSLLLSISLFSNYFYAVMGLGSTVTPAHLFFSILAL